jgi:hypothetical protein
VQKYNPCVPTAIPGKTKASRRRKGKNKRHIASLLTPICLDGQAGKKIGMGVFFDEVFLHGSKFHTMPGFAGWIEARYC